MRLCQQELARDLNGFCVGWTEHFLVEEALACS
jgi:hypothetical protein